MPKQINDQHYKTLTSHERFVLLIEAMARRDDAEADRLEATCPWYLYKAEDQAFRDRMRRAHMIASRVALGLEGPLAKVQLAKSLHEHAEAFSGPLVHLAQLAFLYGREYGKWEVGEIEQIDVPEEDAFEREVATNPDLQLQLRDLARLGVEVTANIFEELHQSLARSYLRKVIPSWRSFDAFCRDTLGIEPLVAMKAYGLMEDDPEEVLAELQEDAAKSEDDRGLQWTARWNQRFNR